MQWTQPNEDLVSDTKDIIIHGRHMNSIIGCVTLVTITETIPVPCHIVKWNSSEESAFVDFTYEGYDSSNELQWLYIKTGHQDSSHNNGHKSDMPYNTLVSITETIPVPCHMVKWNSSEESAFVDFTYKGCESSNELQWLYIKTGHQDSSRNNDHKSDMPYYTGT